LVVHNGGRCVMGNSTDGPQRLAAAEAQRWTDQWMATAPPLEQRHFIRQEHASSSIMFTDQRACAVYSSCITKEIVPLRSKSPSRATRELAQERKRQKISLQTVDVLLLHGKSLDVVDYLVSLLSKTGVCSLK
jgi:hypothetical protein